MYPQEITFSDAKLRENRVNMLRLESFAPMDFIKNTLTSFKESGVELKNYLLFLQGFKGDDKSLSAIRSSISKAKDLGGFNFVSHANELMACPTGFKGDFLEYCMTLNENMTPILAGVLGEINLFNIELSQFISNKSIKTSLRDDKNKVKTMAATRVKLTESLGSFFTNGSNQRLKLSTMYANSAAIMSASTQALQAYEKAYASKPTAIKSDVETIVQKLQIIIDQAEGHDDVEVSQEAMLNLAEKAYELGRQVEMLALFSTQAETAAVLSSYNLDRLT